MAGISDVRATDKVTRITGGTQVGGNLFFNEDFSVPLDETVHIEVAPTVRRVFWRVTGSEPSLVDGKITLRQPDESISQADFFLINSNATIFGPNASLALRGSFITTTAASINFEDGFQFGPDTEEDAKFTDSSPVALQFGDTPGKIVNRSFQRVQDDDGNPIFDAVGQRIYGLNVAKSQTLALVGGDVVIEAETPEVAGGRLTAIAGRIEVGSVISADLVGLTPVETGWAIDYEKVQKFGTIQLANGAVINSSGGGAIEVQGREVTLAGLSQIFSITREQPGATLQVTASDSITVSDALSSIRTETEGPNPGGDVEISTRRLAILDGGRIGSATLDEGPGGDVRVRADSVTLSGIGIIGDQRILSLLYVRSFGTGAPGKLIIETATPPKVLEGGEIITAEHPRNSKSGR
jgi:filamentous hemagglutinin family protein